MKIDSVLSRLSGQKGRWCPFRSVFCQEGYCRECQIYHEGQGERGGVAGSSGRSTDIRRSWLTGKSK